MGNVDNGSPQTSAIGSSEIADVDFQSTLRVLIVDDEKDHLFRLGEMLNRRFQIGIWPGTGSGFFNVTFSTCGSVEELDQLVESIKSGGPLEYDVIVSDVVMPMITGGPLSIEGGALRIYRALQSRLKEEPTLAQQMILVITTAQNDITEAVSEEVNRDQANERVPWAIFLSKPAGAVGGIPDGRQLENATWLRLVVTAISRYHDMRWRRTFIRDTWCAQMVISPALQQVLTEVCAYAEKNIVLIIGERGTGKERVAERLHALSGRPGKLVTVSCRTVDADEVRLLLFGHERDTARGLSNLRLGVFERACQGGKKGTVFLDEFGHDPALMCEIGSLLYQVIVDGVYRRIGGTKDIHYKGGIIIGVSSREALDALRAEGAGDLMDDFASRISCCSVSIPALRQRPMDITALSNQWLNTHLKGCTLTRDAEVLLKEYSWPGNERELEDFLELLKEWQDDPTVSKEDVEANMKRMDIRLDRRSTHQIYAMIARGEGPELEFKETYEWDVRECKKSAEILHSSLKTIAAFLNTDGGNLLLGVTDSGVISGMSHDFDLISKGIKKDAFQNKIREHLRILTPLPLNSVRVFFDDLPEGSVCRIEVSAVEGVTYLKHKDSRETEDVYVRDGNRTLRLEGKRRDDWILSRCR